MNLQRIMISEKFQKITYIYEWFHLHNILEMTNGDQINASQS